MDAEKQKVADEKRKKADEEEGRLGKQTRQSANRFLGLAGYGTGVCLLVQVGIGSYDNPPTAMKDWVSMEMSVLVALICFSIGYTYTSERKKKK